MKIEQNVISRDWVVCYKDRRFFINFTESDGQTLALLNRGNWQIFEQTEQTTEELDTCIFKDSPTKQRKQIQQNIKLAEKLINHCIDNWDNGFIEKLKEELCELQKTIVSK